ncbi:MAG: hypothetical protein A2Y33_02530 [Spirochaetes bacterium GWF1_51_8]|nr:MAG: hypothetical protein A2Y33_02530 [Spirochaetes bacterium GWF1_51_8]
MKRFFNLAAQETLLVFRNKFHWFMLVLLVMMGGAYHLIPDSIPKTDNRYFIDNTKGKLLTAVLTNHGVPAGNILTDKNSITALVASNRDNIGIILDQAGDAAPVFTVIHNGELSAHEKNILHSGLEELLTDSTAEKKSNGFVTVELGGPALKVPLRVSLLPVLLTFEVMVLGFLFVAVVIFQEKQEGSIRAYRVSPGGVCAYVLSKTLVWVVLSVLYGIVLLLATVGFGIDYLAAAMLLTAGSLLMTLFGMAVAVFFSSISEWFFIGVAILVINMLPQVSFLYPVFAPAWITLLPSYPMIFAARDIVFGQPAGSAFWSVIGLLAAESAVMLAAALVLVRLKLMKKER